MDFGDAKLADGVVQERLPVDAARLKALGVDLAKDFPGATADEFLEYPVMTEGGWFLVVKHQPTLRTVSRLPWKSPVTLLTDGLEYD